MQWNLLEVLDHLQQRGECERIEAKSTKSNLGKSALETICAFSNEPGLDGGYLLLGLKEIDVEEAGSRFEIQGVDDPEKLQSEIVNVCRNTFNIKINVKVTVEVIKGKALVLAYIPEAFSQNKPVFIKKYGLEKGAFRRFGPSDIRCTSNDLDYLYQHRSLLSYESEVIPGVDWEDIDSNAIDEYRRLREKIDRHSPEIQLDNKRLLFSLKVAKKHNENIVPTVAGLLLFGTRAALRREFPTSSRVDYIVMEGNKWVDDGTSRYKSATEYREPLVWLMPRLHAEVMGGIASSFGLNENDLQRNDTPQIPRNVIREAIANAIMHRDYHCSSPTQVIKYNNRIEFRNSGYSLKSIEDLQEPRSHPRNPILSEVFRDLKWAETKGTGIRTMIEKMGEANLDTPPIFESSREKNEFDLIILPHHLLDESTLQWLSLLSELGLSDAQQRSLAFAKNVGAITNQDYRQINDVDTLGASRALVQLRDLGLLKSKGSGSGTYYKLDEQLLSKINKLVGRLTPHTNGLSGELTPQTNGLSGELTPQTNPLCKGVDAVPNEFYPLPEKLKTKLEKIGKRPKKEEVKDLIKSLCSIGALRLSQLTRILDKNPKYLREKYLTQMIKNGELIYLHPNQPAHPQQAYMTPRTLK